MFKTLLLVSFTLISTFLFSQDQDALSSMARFNLGIHGIEASYDYPLSSKWIASGAIGAGMGGYTNGSTVSFLFDIIKPVPFTKVRMRYIYNRKKRVSKGKSIKGNSGNYIGFQGKYSFGNASYWTLNQLILSEVHWGIERSKNKSIFNFHLGLGHFSDLDRGRSRLIPTLGILWGWQIFKPKK